MNRILHKILFREKSVFSTQKIKKLVNLILKVDAMLQMRTISPERFHDFYYQEKDEVGD